MKPEEYWKGNDDYHERQVRSVESNEELFYKILFNTGIWASIESIIELGAGTGHNIKALHDILSPQTELLSVEINKAAAEKIPHGNVIVGNVLDFKLPKKCDLAFTKGLAIHIHPNDINKLYAKLYECSNRYILMAEYYNPTPVEVEYRGEMGRLWKRDFSGEMLDLYPDLELIDYGFVYYRDPYPQDSLHWFLMEKK